MFDNLYIIIFIFLISIFILILLPKIFSSKYLFLFRNLFASWKLFDTANYKLVVKYKIADKSVDIESTLWKEYDNKIKLTFLSVFYNPEANLMLYFNSNLSSLVNEMSINELNEMEENEESISLRLQESMSYNILKSFVVNQIIESRNTNTNTNIIDLDNLQYLFKIVSIDPISKIEEDILLSPIYDLI